MELTKNLTQGKLFKSLVVIVLGSIALTISAKIKIPFYPVPMTMQTFVVLFLGISLGHKIALATIGLYLIEGIAGLPVFSNSPERGIGLAYFAGPTMGYLIGFISATGFACYTITIRWKPETPKFTTVAIAWLFCAIFSLIMLIIQDKAFLSSGKNQALFSIHGTLVCLGLILYSMGSKIIPEIIAVLIIDEPP